MKKKEKATAHVKLFPSTHRRLKLMAVKKRMTLPEIVAYMEHLIWPAKSKKV